MKPKLVIIASLASSLINFRLNLMKEFLANGYEVVAFAPYDEETAEILNTIGIRFTAVPLVRNGRNPVTDLLLLKRLYILLRTERPQMVFSYTIKPVIFGSIAAKMAGVPNIYCMITGTGYIFSRNSWKEKLVGAIGKKLFGLALRLNEKVIFQNKDNLAFFRGENLIQKNQKTAVVNGSGVDVTHFTVAALPRKPIFLMIARLLAEKGIHEYVAAAKIVKQHYPDTTFLLVGWLDSNPHSIQASDLKQWVEEGVIEYLGKLKDVRPAIAQASVYVLPSYAEGTPRTVLEAMAMGRAIITTDAPGCRETVISGENGFLVPIKNAASLVNAMLYFHQHPEAIIEMGAASRKLACEKYDVNKVNACMLKEMNIICPKENARVLQVTT